MLPLLFLRRAAIFLLATVNFPAADRQFSCWRLATFLLLLAIFLLLAIDIGGNLVYLIANLLTAIFPVSVR